MDKQNLEELQQKIEKELKKANKRKRLKMRVSGAGVKKLQKVIQNKTV